MGLSNINQGEQSPIFRSGIADQGELKNERYI